MGSCSQGKQMTASLPTDLEMCLFRTQGRFGVKMPLQEITLCMKRLLIPPPQHLSFL